MQNDLRTVKTSEVRANTAALRGVDKEKDQYKNLRDSVSRVGIQQTISVRERNDEKDGTPYFEVVDGLQRYSAACDVGLEEIPVKVLTADDMEVLEAQIIGNLVRVDTDAIHYTKQLHRMMALNPALTNGDVAEKVSQSVAWVQQRLGLLKLDESIQKLVSSNDIPLQNAYSLSKLPKEEQHNFVEAAMTQTPGEFVPAVKARVKQLQEAARAGKSAEGPTFVATSHLRSKKDLESEITSPNAGPSIVASENITTAGGGFKAGLQWALSLDKASLEAARQKFDARQKQLAADKVKREQERLDKQAKEANEKAAKARGESTVTA